MADLNTDYWAAYDAKIKKEMAKPVAQQAPIVKGAGAAPGTIIVPAAPAKPVRAPLTPQGQARQNDMATGKDLLKEYFGRENEDMNKVIGAREAAAYGNDPRTALLRGDAVQGLNQSAQTAMRGLQSSLGSSGVRGGAAAGMGLNIASNLANQRGVLERQLTVDDLNRRDQALGALESTLTGERGGLLGGMFGYAGLGAADRANDAQTGFGQDYLDYLNGEGKYKKPVQVPVGYPTTSGGVTSINGQSGGITAGAAPAGTKTAGGGTTGKAKHF